LIIYFSDVAGLTSLFFRRHHAFTFAGRLSSELSTSSLTDARRIKPGGDLKLLLFSSPLGQTNSGLTE
jgi:hypothetical protein